MTTKKITLNELRSIVKQIIKEETETMDEIISIVSNLNDAIHSYRELVNTNQMAYELLGYSDEDAKILDAAFTLSRKKELILNPKLFR